MIKKTLYYLGPENTFSHAVAQTAQAQLPDWQNACLEPCTSATDIFTKLKNNPNAGGIAPVYNLEQGVVHDFTRFYLFDPIWEHKLYVKLSLFSQAPSLQQVKTLVTKDTVIPQVSHWLATLPPHINIDATPYISTAASAKRAAQEPHTAAICSPQAGQQYKNLRELAPNLANNTDSYTLFKLFVQPETYWHDSQLFPAPEHPHHLTPSLAKRLRSGDCQILWHKSARTPLHLGHYSTLLTLRKLARWGNQIQIDLGAQQTAVTEQTETAVRQFLGTDVSIQFIGTKTEAQPPTADLIVAGIEHIHDHPNQPAIFVDTLPGTDGYAKMETARGNTLPWPQSEDFAQLPPLFSAHFTAERLA